MTMYLAYLFSRRHRMILVVTTSDALILAAKATRQAADDLEMCRKHRKTNVAILPQVQFPIISYTDYNTCNLLYL